MHINILKESSSSRLATLVKEANRVANRLKQQGGDGRFWRYTPDKIGNAVAVFRFLPAPKVDGDDALPWVRFYEHAFPSNGKWYIEKCRSTLGEADPCHEMVRTLWAEGNEEQGRKMGRKQVFISNILMVNDTGNPENNAKVFLYRYGVKIFENKIMPLLRPQNGIGIQEIDPFDFWTGAHFMLKVKKVSNFPNYDGSMFLPPSSISDNEAIIESIWASEYSLKEFADPKSFKTYDELSQRLQTVMGSKAPEPAQTNGNGSASSQEVEEFDELIHRLKR